MARDARKRYLVVALLSLVGGGLLLWVSLLWLGSDVLDSAHGQSGSADVGGSATFSISGGSARPMSPGTRVPLDLTITNPHDFTLAVSHLVVRVSSVVVRDRAHPRSCSAADFSVAQVSTVFTIRIAAHSARTLSSSAIARVGWPHVGMLDRSVNQDGCQGALLHLAYTGSARRAP